MNKSLVSFFAVLLVVISLFQLSFTYFVNQHESQQLTLANSWLAENYPSSQTKYPSNTQQQKLYQDTLDTYLNNHYTQLLERTKDDIITYGLQGEISYQKAKESELNLGLDLQGGISVTLEIRFEDFLSSQVINPDDPMFRKALNQAVAKRYERNINFIDLFIEQYNIVAPTISLLTIFDLNKMEKLPSQPTDADIIRILKSTSQLAMENTFNILSKRIDQFGVAQPYINLDKDKGTITVELAGVNNLDRVRTYLQSSANLEFYEVYPINEVSNSFITADQQLAQLIKSRKKSSDKADKPSVDSHQVDDQLGLDLLLQESNNPTSDSNLNVSSARDNNPLLSLMIQSQRQSTAEIGYVAEKDKLLFEDYIKQSKKFFPRNSRVFLGLPIKNDNINIYPVYVLRANAQNKPQLEGKHITNSSQDFDPLNPSRVVVNMEMNIEGTRLWRELTQKNIDKPVAVALDGVVYTAPTVNSVISDGRSQISGNFTIEEGQDLSKILKAGKLPVSASIVQEQVVGPTLGLETIKKGSFSFLVSFIIIFILMLVYYNSGGWIANIALLLNILFTVGVLSALGATLTAAGIAGLILTIGMAVDANVIIFERIKEELYAGNGIKSAVNKGFNRSLSPVLDSHITTLLTAVILYSFGLGPVKGFATTQILGILLSLFCGILFSRLITEWWVAKKQRKIKFFTPLSKNLFKKANFKFIENRKYAYFISVVVVAAGIGTLFNGFNEGVEFSGGRSYTVQFSEKIKPENIRNPLKVALEGESPIIKTLGDGYKLNITTSYLINKNSIEVDNQVLEHVFEGLKPQFTDVTSFEDFKNTYLVGSSKVLPTISEDLKLGAKWATFWSLLLISIYIFIRFRDWRYSLGTIIALFHDVFVMLIIFSFAKNLVPFSLEIDQHFIAAVLTVIGFSMNDTIIVFDRIREHRRLMPSANQKQIINSAVNSTLSRTIMTSITVLLTILILFLLGGDVTKGFAFALLIGVLTGTYSSIFVAAPVLIDLRIKKKNRSDNT